MNNRRTNHRLRRVGPAVLAAGILLALFGAPATRWLVQSQFDACGLSLRPAGAQVRRADEARRHFIAAHPDDLQTDVTQRC